MKAFTLVELIIVLVIIGLVAAIGLPSINKARLEAEIESKRAFAVQLQTAKMGLIEDKGYKGAVDAWNAYAGATADENRYDNLLKPYLKANADIPEDLSDMFTIGYTLSLGDLDTAITLKGPDADGNAEQTIPLYKY